MVESIPYVGPVYELIKTIFGELVAKGLFGLILVAIAVFCLHLIYERVKFVGALAPLVRERFRNNAQVRNLKGQISGLEREAQAAQASLSEATRKLALLEASHGRLLEAHQMRSDELVAARASVLESKAALEEAHTTPQPEPRPPLDNDMVVLFRRYGVPAYVAARELLRTALEQCFAHAGWTGIAAHYFKYDLTLYGDDPIARVEDCINGIPGTGSFDEEFKGFYRQYLELVCAAFHFGSLDILHDPKLLKAWDEADRDFATKVLDVSSGLNQDALNKLVRLMRGRMTECRQLLRALMKAPTPQ